MPHILALIFPRPRLVLGGAEIFEPRVQTSTLECLVCAIQTDLSSILPNV
jgi:hypothetical protein